MIEFSNYEAYVATGFVNKLFRIRVNHRKNLWLTFIFKYYTITEFQDILVSHTTDVELRNRYKSTTDIKAQ